ncbi:MAG: hypothetical protein ABL971_09640 [Vicinamibacterales bacterium]
MWRDPLDELIEDLDRVAPERASAWEDQLMRLQALADAVLYGTPDQVAAIQADPAYQEWAAALRGPSASRS